MKKTSFLFLILLALLLNACIRKNPNGWGPWYKIPAPTLSTQFPQYDAKDDYQKGFNDGCQTFYSIVGSGAARLLPTRVDGWKLTNKNPKTGQSPHPDIKNGGKYVMGFGDGMEHCTYTIDWNIV